MSVTYFISSDLLSRNVSGDGNEGHNMNYVY